MKQELEKLPEQQRDVLVYRYFHGLTNQQTAITMGISKSAVNNLVFRAKTYLATKFRALADFESFWNIDKE